MRIETFHPRTGTHSHEVGTVWGAQDGPGPGWYETVIPGPRGVGWVIVRGGSAGRYDRAHIPAVAAAVAAHGLTKDSPKGARMRARRDALEAVRLAGVTK